MSDTTAVTATTTDSGAPAGEQAATPSPADLAARAAAQAAAAPADGQQQTDTSGWPPEAVAEVERLRERANGLQAEAMKSRHNAKATAAEQAQQDTLAKIAEALGLAPAADAERPTVESVTAQLAERTGEADEARREAALLRAAVEKRIDPARLDYFQYLASRDAGWRGASPSADDFTATLTATVDSILSADPTLVAAAPPRVTGAETYGGASGSEVTLDAFESMNASERSKLYTTDPAAYQRLNDEAWAKSRGR